MGDFIYLYHNKASVVLIPDGFRDAYFVIN